MLVKEGKRMDEFEKRFSYLRCVLSNRICELLNRLTKVQIENAQEIILRTNRPVSIYSNNEQLFFTENGCVVNKITDQKMHICSKNEIFEIFHNICNYSVYSRQYEINNGYITLKGGHRAGICGTAVTNGESIVNIKDISSINIRISREIKGCSKTLLNFLNPQNGVLICGPPSSGKTTLIRDIARTISYQYKTSLIDERNEISATVNGISQNDIGLCDVYDNYKKSVAIEQAIRTMSPQIIVCDELGSIEDIDAVRNAVNCGVSFIATVHCNSENDLLVRENLKNLLKTYAFSKIIFLDTRENVGEIKKTMDISEVRL